MKRGYAADIYGMVPVNGTANIVTNQKKCVEETSVNREELVIIYKRLFRKQRLFRHVLGIRSNRQRKNIVARLRKARDKYGRVAAKRDHPRIYEAFILNGDELCKISRRIAELKKGDA
jgi:hypothetical protein